MIKIREAILVEGKYDKNTLSQIVDAAIFQTNGFGILRDKSQLALLRRVAEKQGLIILTDSDGAGFVIRNYLKGAIPASQVKHAYIPDVFGKERRKTAPGKEGKVGVEGMPVQVILESLRRAGATFENEETCSCKEPFTKQDFYEFGLSGGKSSSEKRRKLLKLLDLPEHMSSNAMLQALSLLYSKEELLGFLQQLEK